MVNDCVLISHSTISTSVSVLKTIAIHSFLKLQALRNAGNRGSSCTCTAALTTTVPGERDMVGHSLGFRTSDQK